MKPKLESCYPLVKAVHIILQQARYESIRFLPLKRILKELVGEINFEMTGERKDADFLPEFGDISFIEEIENHYLEPSK